MPQPEKAFLPFGDRSISVPAEELPVGGKAWTRSKSEKIVTKVSDRDFQEEVLEKKVEAITLAAATTATTATTTTEATAAAAAAATTSAVSPQENQTETLGTVEQKVYDFPKSDNVDLYQSKVGIRLFSS